MKRIYLSGPMSGLPELNFPAFHAAAAQLRALEFDVVNPAEISVATGADWNACMRADIAALVGCDTIALLPGWERSQGAHLELHIAHRVGLHVAYLEDFTAADDPGQAGKMATKQGVEHDNQSA